MISNKYRYHGHGSLKYVYKNGRMVRGSMSSLKYISNSRRKSYRLAIVVSKKVNKSAVVRNRIRRRLYEAVRQLECKFKAPYDMVITVYSEQLAILPAEEIRSIVANHLGQAKII